MNDVSLCDTSLLYVQVAVSGTVWHPPMAVEWDFTLVKASDERFQHLFPSVLVGSIFKNLKAHYMSREHVHVIRKDSSLSFSMRGLERSYDVKWGDGFPPNAAHPSDVYRESCEEDGAWIDTNSLILYYTKCLGECVYEGEWSVFGGSNPIPQEVRCSEFIFSRFLNAIRENYVRIACNSATVCLVRDGYIQSTHKVRTVSPTPFI
jgi:hypothetical protein